MDPSRYKQLATSAGQTYNYYTSPARDGRPTLLLVHGFPSSSYDWRHQVAYFEARGFGLIVPDQLGYGGTSKPTDVEAYRASSMARSMVEILDAEGVGKAIAIGHDWGAFLVSRIANFYPDRFLAFAFLSVGYQNPEPVDFVAALAMLKQAFGYEPFGYQLFFAADGADAVIEKHIDSFLGLLYPHDPETWKTDLAPTGALEAYLRADKQGPPPPYITEQDKAFMRTELLKGGFKAPLNWYKQFVHGVGQEDAKSIPRENWSIAQPVFFAAALRDYVCLPVLALPSFGKYCPNFTTKEYESDHWVLLSHHEQLNRDLEEWIERVTA